MLTLTKLFMLFIYYLTFAALTFAFGLIALRFSEMKEKVNLRSRFNKCSGEDGKAKAPPVSFDAWKNTEANLVYAAANKSWKSNYG